MLANLFRSLRHHNFRLYFAGQLVSITGTWMQNVAQAWLVYRLTDSSAMLGLVAFSGLAPILLLGLPAGMIADRISRRRLLLGAQAIAMLQAFTLAALTFAGEIQVWEVIVLALVLGVVHALEMPTRHAFLAELVPREDLPNAVALNSSLFNIARFLGPAAAGWLVAVSGEGLVFLINGGSFAAVVLVLLAIRIGEDIRPGGSKWLDFIDGLRFAWHTPTLRRGLLLLTFLSLGGTAYSVLMPIFADRVFGGGAETLGHLLGTAGGGALLAALRLAYLGGRQPLEHDIAIATVVAGFGMLSLSLIGQLWLALPVLLVLGFCLTTVIASIVTLLQLNTPRELRGRVMSLFSVLFIGVTSVGNLMAGFIAEQAGVAFTVALFGLTSLAAGAGYRRGIGAREGQPGSSTR
jgi:MFS family permease